MTGKSEIKRKTRETDIELSLELYGTGVADIKTGVGFLDHMLTGFAAHSGMNINVRCSGDLNVDAHHSVEDTGIVLGCALAEALGDKKGITRFGSASIPMDEALACCSLDISGRPYLVFDADFVGDKCGDMDTQLFEEFFRAVAVNAGITLHLSSPYGANDHHKAEALFKSFARAVRQAVARDEVFADRIPSSKGVL